MLHARRLGVALIYDCFTLFNEIELLKIRLRYLYPCVEKFIICEANKTHSGIDKPFNFEAHINEFDEWIDKIIYVRMDINSIPKTSWHLENSQRNKTFEYLNHICRDGDVVLVSDLDEFPDVSKLPAKLEDGQVYRFVQHFRFYHSNWRRKSLPYWFGGTVAVRYNTIKNGLLIDKPYDFGPGFIPYLNIGVTATKLRLYRYPKLIFNGGWHFSYMGGAERVSQKLSAFSHQELPTYFRDDSYIKGRLESGIDVLSNDKLIAVDSPFDLLKDFEGPNSNLGSINLITKFLDKILLIKFWTKLQLKKIFKI